ncbi:probable serine/threonine-protein kinase DDB_G0292354 [Contarinia nasturtii]|uniref:probable serine/threonine-protein kinase DDB_G0292354 n=1 Tax=Contarinia nasturtii TaxID=265458 RepID=UPI0012D3A1DC|nr:probable serine/threonine-protein kinase DDB_G0292354 [Contarinia nasturtii]
MIGYDFNENYQYMLMELLGESFSNILKNKKQLDLPYVLKIGHQVVQRLKVFHNQGYVHNDIKPANVMTSTKNDTIYLIDYGLSVYLGSGSTLSGNIVGSPHFMAIDAHTRKMSFKNDMESLAYMLIYLLEGSLPWTKVKYSNLDRNCYLEKLLMMKREAYKDLAMTLPEKLRTFLKYTREMKDNEKPNYDFICGIFVSNDGSPKNKRQRI